jgi:hypothetical protein
MTVEKLGKMYGVSQMVIYRIMEENKFDLQIERQNYKNKNIIINEGVKVNRCKYYGNHTLKLA